MERLPDRPDYENNSECQNEESSDKKLTKAERRKKILRQYGLLFIFVFVVWFVMADSPVNLDDITVNKIDVVQNDKANGIFVVGEVPNEVGKISKATVSFDETTGAASVYVKAYQVTTFFGSQQFVAYIEEEPTDVKEIWLVYDDLKGTVEKKQLEYCALADSQGVAQHGSQVLPK